MQWTQFGMPVLLMAATAGAVVGFLSGVFGVGGGFLLVPVLNIVLGIPMEYAVGAGACQVLGPATTSLLARRITYRDLRLPLVLAGGLLCGVWTGADVLQTAKQAGQITLRGRDVPVADVVVLVVYFLLLTSVGCFALWEAHLSRRGRSLQHGWLSGVAIPPRATFREFDHSRVSIPILAWFGLGVGLLAGLLGMSGGLILLPGLVYLLGMRTQEAVISSLVIVWIVAFQSTIAHSWHGNVDLLLVMVLLVGGTVGARIGSEFGVRLKGAELRQRFGWILLGTATLIGGRMVRLLLF